MRSVVALLSLLFAINVLAADPQPSFYGSWRVRLEDWRYFDAGAGDSSYVFGASKLRLGVRHSFGALDTVGELEQVGLFHLPSNASLPAPIGQLGVGANYYSANGTTTHPAGLFVKQLTFSRKTAHGSWRLGRFEYSDALERTPENATIATLVRERVAQRLIGPFNYSHVGRVFDGGELKAGNATFFAARPSVGAYEVHGGGGLPVGVAYASYIIARKTSDSRLFALAFRDTRDAVVKTDNRPLAVRTADGGNIDVVTLGGNRVTTLGPFDTVVWGAAQFGHWGVQRHRANAFDLEAGWHGPVTVRGGYYRSSGDRNPGDDEHNTWFPGLPTSRVYARFPLYNSMNSRDAFAMLSLKPRPTVTLAFEAHRLGLTSANDLWYSGGGASDRATFGVSGRPSSGRDDLATIVDANVEWRPNAFLTVTLYAAHASGGSVVRNLFPGNTANYAYLEVLRRF